MLESKKLLLGVGALAIVAVCAWWFRPGSDGAGPRSSQSEVGSAAEHSGEESSDSSFVSRVVRTFVGSGDDGAGETEARGRVEGLVRDPAGNRVADVDVIFRHRSNEATATANGSGEFAIELAGGTYAVRVAGDRLISRPHPAIRVVASEQPLHIEVVVERLARLRGTVVDHAGASVPDATVHFVAGPAEATLVKDGLLIDRVPVDSDGRFEIDVPARNQLLVAARAGFLRGEVTVRDLLPGDTRDNVTIALHRGIEVAGSVVDPSGRRVAGAEVNLNVKAGGTAQAQRVASDGNGRYVFEPMAPGMITLEARADGFAPSAPLRKKVGPGDDALADITLSLQRGEVISGRVVDQKGNALGGVRIRVGRRYSRFKPRQIQTNDDGEFEVAGLDRGRHWVGAAMGGFATATKEAVLPPKRGLEIVLVRHGGIRGRVTDSNGQPLPSFVVRIHSIEHLGLSGKEPRSDEIRFSAGSYKLDRLAPGRYDISITAPGHRTAKLGLDVAPGDVADGSAVLVAN